MKKTVIAVAALCALGIGSSHAGNKMAADTTPAEDLKTYRDFFMKRFPGVPLQEFANGVYAIDKVSRDSWLAIEEFPPYEVGIEDGEGIWNTPFANGKSFSSCFADGPGQRKNYPAWDDKSKSVVTLPQAINACLKANGEKEYKYIKGKNMNALLAYMGYESRGQKTDVKVPNADAVAAYNDGKTFYFARRGQLNFSCAHCHVESAGMHIRTDVLSPLLGHTTGWPVYRSKWGSLGTLHRRFRGCNNQVRAKPFSGQSEEYRNLEYFMTHVSNGIEYNGPSARK
ncbi:MAG: sulfur oxidation c-type cytochrome SoxA [bacterium]